MGLQTSSKFRKDASCAEFSFACKGPNGAAQIARPLLNVGDSHPQTLVESTLQSVSSSNSVFTASKIGAKRLTA